MEDLKLWYDEKITDHKTSETLPDELIIGVKNEAKLCWDAEVANYNIKSSKTNPNYQWMKTVMSQGAMSDKIAANIVCIQESPIHNINTLSNLVDMVKVSKKKDCLLVIESVVELLLSYLLPPNRKLIPFRNRPINSLTELTSGNGFARKKYLSYWYFEDQLKELYTAFVKALNSVAHDTVDNNKERALTAMLQLLSGNPEQEKNLLSNIINKLGDPSRKIASKSIYCLTQLLKKHPNMQGVVLDEIEKLLFRTNISSKAQYYALCFLSQFYLSHEVQEIARRLIELYFSFFKACVKKGEVNSRMMSALLMGVNRAYPYAKLEMEKISDHINTMYRIVHIAEFNVSLHALTLLFQVSDQSNNLGDRFYSALYKKLLDPKIATTTHQAMLLSLTYKALLKDTQEKRVQVLIKRLLQNALYMQPPVACGILFLVSQVISKNRKLCALHLNSKSENSDEVKPPKLDNRNPLYAGEDCGYAELNILQNNFHPTISLFASNILKGITIKYTGDPLQDFSLIKFLDRFVYKNPKQVNDKEGCHSIFGKRKYYVPRGVRSLSVKSTTYLNSNQANIPIDELFLHSHLVAKNMDKNNKEDDDSDLESVNSEEFEDMLDKMTTTKGDISDDVNYMDDFEETVKSGKKQTPEDIDLDYDQDSEDEQLDEENIESDEDLQMTKEDKELTEFSDEDDGSELEFDSEDEKPAKKKKKTKTDVPIFASAEEFASLLEDEGNLKIAPGGSNAWENKDKANLRQIEWEDKRNQWVQGYNKQKTSKTQNIDKKNKTNRKNSSSKSLKNKKKRTF